MLCLFADVFILFNTSFFIHTHTHTGTLTPYLRFAPCTDQKWSMTADANNETMYCSFLCYAAIVQLIVVIVFTIRLFPMVAKYDGIFWP